MHSPQVSSPPHAASSVDSTGRSRATSDTQERWRADRPATWLFVLVAVVLIYFVGRVLLLAFAGVLLAVLLNGLSSWIAKHTRLPYGWSLAIVVVALLILAGLAVWRMQAAVIEQVNQFSQAFPESLSELRSRLEQAGLGGWLPEQMPSASSAAQQSGIWSRLRGLASGTLGAVVDVVVILFVGLYAAVEPGLYQCGVRHLVPIRHRPRAEQVLCTLGTTLRWWIIGKLCSMLIVGTLIGVGLGLLGVKLALLLGIIAGLLALIPNFGPVIAAVPAILIAWSQSSQTALYVLALFVVVEFAESYLFLPLIEREAVHVPPALIILSIVLMGMLAGTLGVLVATPLLAAAIVLVRMLYVEDRLGDRSADIAGENACN